MAIAGKKSPSFFCNRRYIFIHGCFYVVMLVFWEVKQRFFLHHEKRSEQLNLPWMQPCTTSAAPPGCRCEPCLLPHRFLGINQGGSCIMRKDVPQWKWMDQWWSDQWGRVNLLINGIYWGYNPFSNNFVGHPSEGKGIVVKSAIIHPQQKPGLSWFMRGMIFFLQEQGRNHTFRGIPELTWRGFMGLTYYCKRCLEDSPTTLGHI